jgi:hypothetical protein
MLDMPPPFEEQNLESFFRQFLCCPASGDTRTNDDCIEFVLFCHGAPFWVPAFVFVANIEDDNPALTLKEKLSAVRIRL